MNDIDTDGVNKISDDGEISVVERKAVEE